MASPEENARIVLEAAIKDLHGTVQTLNKTVEGYTESSNKQAEKMICLTRVITGLTIALFVGLVVQILLAIWTG